MSKPSSSSTQALSAQSRPWWREYMLWLVIGGPAVVVVASFVTLTLAIRNPDPVLEPGKLTAQPSHEHAGSKAKAETAAYVPAMQGRNHAATGGSSGK